MKKDKGSKTDKLDVYSVLNLVQGTAKRKAVIRRSHEKIQKSFPFR